jgi:heat shock gene repressor HrcA
LSVDVPIGTTSVSLAQLDERSREIFRRIVESYLATGDPVGSRNVSRILQTALSPASVRNVMADLEALGLVYAPHTSAGRLPTEYGLRFYVDALLEFGDLSGEERRKIEAQVTAARDDSLDNVLNEATAMLSGLARGAGVVTAAKTNPRLRHVEFVGLEPGRALMVLVSDDGQVENRLLTLAPGLPASALVEATNFLNSRVRGKTLAEIKTELEGALSAARAELDELTQRIVAAGLASWSGGDSAERKLIASESLGDAKFFIRRAADYAKERVVFGRPIGQNQGVAFPIARAHAETVAAELVVRKATALFEAERECGAEATMGKMLAADAAWKAADTCLQTFGGFGYAREYGIERKWRETRLYQTAPISTNMILAYVAQHILGLPRSY